jgi:hypothetical protein
MRHLTRLKLNGRFDPDRQLPQKKAALVMASLYLPAAMDAVGKKAAAGDLKAVKLLFDLLWPQATRKSGKIYTQQS